MGKLAYNIQTKAKSVSPVSPGISLSVQFDSQPDTTTAESLAEFQNQSQTGDVESGEEFDLDLSPSKDTLDHQNPSFKTHVNVSDKSNKTDVYYDSNKIDTQTLTKEEEVTNRNEVSTKHPEGANNANFLIDQSLAIDKNLQPRMLTANPQENSDCDYLHQNDLMDKLQEGKNQKKKVQRIKKSTLIKAKPMKPKFKKKERKHSSANSQNTVHQKCKNKLPLQKVKDKKVAQEPEDKTMLDRKKQVKNSMRFMELKVKNLQSASFEVSNVDHRKKPKRKKTSERNKSKKEVKEDVMKMIQKMHREILQLLNRRTRMLKEDHGKSDQHHGKIMEISWNFVEEGQEKTAVLFSETVATEE